MKKNLIEKVGLSTLILLAGLSLLPFSGQAQARVFTRADTLRGTITPERAWWDLTYYHLNIKVDPATQAIRGSNTVHYKVLKSSQVLQIDLQPPLAIDRVNQNGEAVAYTREGNVYWLQLKEKQVPATVQQLEIFYSGKPKVSENPPWSGGFTWKQDQAGKPFVATSCQGLGASVWWPCKDHMYDEPDSMTISVNVPQALTDVSNGRLRKVDQLTDGTKTFHWFVSNPINNYGVNVNIGDYVNFSDKYQGEKGNLDLNYYVLRENLEKAKKQFQEVPRMLKALEHWFGPYPFYEDSYKLVEVPYLGMEHQSSVTYGNRYANGYLGKDLSGTGWGLKFDFIIVHESGHEWFANNITYKDIADMWIHESFTAYSENLYLDYHFGKKAAAEYVIGTRANIQNEAPIIGQYNVNAEGSGDMYYKGANMLHTLRQILRDDEKWRQMLRGLNQTFYHQTVTTDQIEQYLAQQAGRDLKPFFNQYLRDVRIPRLEYQVQKGQLQYRWGNVVSGFNMPVKVLLNKKETWLQPTATWQTVSGATGKEKVELDPNFYVTLGKVKN